MHIRKVTMGLMFSALVFSQIASQSAHAQANVNEGQETAFVYVNGATGSDSNPGTQAQPFQTIGKAASVAVANNRKSIGTRVTISTGSYRESISLSSNSNNTSLPITFEAATNGTVQISGADVWTGWAPYTSNPSYPAFAVAERHFCGEKVNLLSRPVDGYFLTIEQRLPGTHHPLFVFIKPIG